MSEKNRLWKALAALAGILGIVSCGASKKASQQKEESPSQNVETPSSKAPSDSGSVSKPSKEYPRIKLMYGVPPTRYREGIQNDKTE